MLKLQRMIVINNCYRNTCNDVWHKVIRYQYTIIFFYFQSGFFQNPSFLHENLLFYIFDLLSHKESPPSRLFRRTLRM